MASPSHPPRPRLSFRSVASALVTVLVVGGASAFVFSQLEPRLLFTNTTPAGGDMGAHVWGPDFLRDNLLSKGRLTGWTPDWYAGFPWLVFYFPIPSLLIAAASWLIPYNIAFKLVTVLGLVTLPIAAWAFGRIGGMKAPTPQCMGAATLLFLFDRSFTIYGGNIPSTLAGEFAFSIALSMALVFLGVFARGLETGRHRALAAALLALTGVTHVVPVFFALGGAVVLTVQHLVIQRGPHRLRFTAPVLAVSGLLAAFWVLPFLARLAYTNDMGWEKITTYRSTLFPRDILWVVALAIVGAGASLVYRRRFGIFLTAMAAASALAFVLAPQGRLWNARLLPFWMLCLYLLVGVAVAELGLLAGRLFVEPVVPVVGDDDEAALQQEDHRARSERAEWVASLVTPFVALAGAVLFVAAQLHLWFAPIKNDERSFIPDWVRWNYSGYERKNAYPEYYDLVQAMKRIGDEEGCGRAMWEYEPELDRMGTPMALMLLPYWTDGCIGSMEGLFFESSATTPYHFLNQSELSQVPSRAQRDLPYRSLDVAAGIEHLQLLGVRYYMAISDEAKAQARTNGSLRLLGTSGPWNVSYKDGSKDRTWEIYAVEDAEIVAPLDYEPVVMQGVSKGGRGWLDAAVAWYQDSTRWAVPLAASGPPEWRRVDGADPDPPRRSVPPVEVSDIRSDDDSISFRVDQVGSPVLVKASYFPNWEVSGARGVWRVTPNQMVVIPTDNEVTLRYGTTPVDAGSWALTLLGLVGLVVLWRRGPLTFPPPPAPLDEHAWGDELDRELASVLDTPSDATPAESPTTPASE